mgnify:CR=1 FL=1
MKTLHATLKQHLHAGTVIPAHPLALNAERKLDEQRQRLLSRYYIASGAGGIAVGVHSTQFEIRQPGIDLYAPVLELAAEEIANANLQRPFLKVAGCSVIVATLFLFNFIITSPSVVNKIADKNGLFK